jgi:hypothetical protein
MVNRRLYKTNHFSIAQELTIEQHGTHRRSGWTYVLKAVSPRRIGHVANIETVLQVLYIHKHSQRK